MQSSICRGIGLALALVLAGLMPGCGQSPPAGNLESGFVSTRDGIRIHYLEAGRRTAKTQPAILFIPGWTMPAEIWEPQLSHFAKKYRVVAMDPRCQGESSQTTEGHYPDARARDIRAVVEQLKLAPVVLVGWSMGVSEVVGYVGQFATQGVAGLVFVDGTAGIEPDLDVMRTVFARVREFQADRPAATAHFVRSMHRSEQPQEYLDRITRASLRTPTNTAMALMLGALATDQRETLGKINVPSLLVAADGPYLRFFQTMHGRIAGSHLKVFEGVGHALFVDAAQKFNSELEAFVLALPDAM